MAEDIIRSDVDVEEAFREEPVQGNRDDEKRDAVAVRQGEVVS